MKSAADLWEEMGRDRDPYLSRARECAELTIPYLFPPEGSSGATNFEAPYQGVGARGVNNLASKLHMSLFPTSGPFFLLELNEGNLAEYLQSEEQAQTVEDEIRQKILGFEERIRDEFDVRVYRPALFEALRHLIVAGNVCLQERKDKALKAFPLTHYTVKRDPGGRLETLVLKEEVYPDRLPESFQVGAQQYLSVNTGKPTVSVYTVVRAAKGKKYEVWQEVESASEKHYGYGSAPIDEEVLPFQVLRTHWIAGEHYGRGFVEEYLGDLKSLEGLTQSILEMAANAARLLWLVNPNSSFRTRLSDLAEAPNGAFRTGSAEDVSALQDTLARHCVDRCISDENVLSRQPIVSGEKQQKCDRKHEATRYLSHLSPPIFRLV